MLEVLLKFEYKKTPHSKCGVFCGLRIVFLNKVSTRMNKQFPIQFDSS